MIRKFAVAAVLAAAFAAPAFASQCPGMMAEIDAALETASLSEADMARVKELRAQGEAQHAAGDHPASEASLAEAKALLGL